MQLDFPQQVLVNAAKQHFRDDGWQMYDTMDASFVFANGKTIKWDGKSRTNYQTYGMDRGSILYGSTGTVIMNRNGYRVFDLQGKLVRERKSDEVAQTTQPGGAGGMDGLHIMNFVNTIRGTAPLQHQPIDEGAKAHCWVTWPIFRTVRMPHWKSIRPTVISEIMPKRPNYGVAITRRAGNQNYKIN